MLVTNCKQLLDTLTSLDRVRDIQRVCESLNGRQQDLRIVKADIDVAQEQYRALTRREPVGGEINGVKAKKYAADLLKSLNNDPESITQGRGFTNLKSAFTKLAEAVTESCNDAWQEYRTKFEPRLDAEQVHQAKQFPMHREDAERLEQIDAATKRLGSKSPRDETAFLELERKWQEIRDLIGKLPPPTANPEIQKFLKAVNSREGADLELLTDQVRAWLSGNSMANKFRIRHA